MSASAAETVSDVQRVTQALGRAAKPAGFRALQSQLRLDPERLKAALEEATREGSAFRWPDHGAAKQRYWTRSPDACAQEAILAVASQAALPRSELMRRARKGGPGFTPALQQRAVSTLIAEGKLQAVPSFTSGKLLIRAGAIAAYEAAARAFLEKKFRKAGFETGALFHAEPKPPSPVPDIATLLLDAMQRTDPSAFEQGFPISAWKLRKQLPDVAKADFDAAALELRRQRKAFLDQHHDPYNLPPAERADLIDGGDGTFYVTIATRR